MLGNGEMAKVEAAETRVKSNKGSSAKNSLEPEMSHRVARGGGLVQVQGAQSHDCREDAV